MLDQSAHARSGYVPLQQSAVASYLAVGRLDVRGDVEEFTD
jgi:hypothetical protein